MLLRVSKPAGRWFFIPVALLCILCLGYFSIRNAFATHAAGLNTKAGDEQAARLEPGNAENWYALGRYWQHSLDVPDAQRAIRYYRAALAIDPRSADIWLDLGTVYELEGDLQDARDAFVQAKRAYPISAEVSWRYGNFLLRQNEIPQAFAEIRHTVYVNPRRSAEAVSRCWRAHPDIQSILENVLPSDRDAYLDVIQLFSVQEQFAAALNVWDRLVALHPPLQLSQAIPFTYTLVEKHQISDARRVWKDALRLSGTPAPPDPPGSLVWDGGFESGVYGGGLAWHLPSTSNGVRTEVDSKEKHSGRQSLRVTFDGRHNVYFDGICNNAEVQPGTPYVFSAWVRTYALTTDQGVRFRLLWTQDSRWASAETSDVRGTQPWTQIQMPWTPPQGVRQVRVCVGRDPSTKFDSQIQGTAWFDDVALVPQSAASPKL
jgi:tetratricopeptide (TPR) repeat protein